MLLGHSGFRSGAAFASVGFEGGFGGGAGVAQQAQVWLELQENVRADVGGRGRSFAGNPAAAVVDSRY
jgi:hypothetical protein